MVAQKTLNHCNKPRQGLYFIQCKLLENSKHTTTFLTRGSTKTPAFTFPSETYDSRPRNI